MKVVQFQYENMVDILEFIALKNVPINLLNI